MKAPEWNEYHKAMREKAPLVIHYPICDGGEECIYVCPFGNEVWEVVPMKVSLFGVRYRVRLRPFIKNPEACRKCYICVQACPTGALRPVDEDIKHPVLALLYNALKLPFKKKYGVKFVFRDEHIQKFRKNNSPEVHLSGGENYGKRD